MMRATCLLLCILMPGCAGMMLNSRVTRVTYVNSDPRQPAQESTLQTLVPVLSVAAPAIGGALGGPWVALATLGGLALLQSAENLRTVEGVGLHVATPTPNGANVTVELDESGNLRRVEIKPVTPEQSTGIRFLVPILPLPKAKPEPQSWAGREGTKGGNP